MSRLVSAVVVATAAVAIALPTIAAGQSAPPTHNKHGNPIAYPSYRAPHIGLRGEYEAFIDGSSGNNLGAQPLERIDLANRVSTLIELGRCSEARALANQAGDRQMALRARQLCRADRRQADHP